MKHPCARDENEYGQAYFRHLIREADVPAKPSLQAIRRLMKNMAQAALQEVNPKETIQKLMGDFQQTERRLEAAEKRAEDAQRNASSCSSSSSSGSDGCFAGNCEVVVQGRGSIHMRDLSCGDLVMGEQGWCKVVDWLHRCPAEPCKMLKVTTTTGAIHATKDHLVFLQDVVPSSALGCWASLHLIYELSCRNGSKASTVLKCYLHVCAAQTQTEFAKGLQGEGSLLDMLLPMKGSARTAELAPSLS